MPSTLPAGSRNHANTSDAFGSIRRTICMPPTHTDEGQRVAAGGTALDPEVVTQLLGASRQAAALDASLTRRESEVLALMAEGRSNTAIADALVIGEGAVEKHVANIFAKLGLPVSDSDNRRVLAVLRYLESGRALSTRRSTSGRTLQP